MKNLIVALFAIGVFASTQAQDLNNRNSAYQQRPRVPHVLNAAEFEQMRLTVKKAVFSDEKKPAFRAVMAGSFITVEQLQVFLKQFTFDDDKLDWAMTAFPYIIDRPQFYKLRDGFSFLTTQAKFDTFLQDMANNDGRGRRSQRAMGRDEFAALQTRIKKEAFADGKQSVFKVAMVDRLITVAQVNELLRQLTFDDDKLTWAKMAYSYTSDTRNYYQLRDVFTFDSNKQKLDKFLLEAAE